MARILLAEDDPYIRKMLILRLSMKGHQIDEVDNGQDAVEKALTYDYPLILMDMHMPLMDGHAATRKLRQAGFSGKIVAVTASAMSEDCQQATESGCDGHISKPIDEQFEDVIEQYLSDASADN